MLRVARFEGRMQSRTARQWRLGAGCDVGRGRRYHIVSVSWAERTLSRGNELPSLSVSSSTSNRFACGRSTYIPASEIFAKAFLIFHKDSAHSLDRLVRVISHSHTIRKN